MLPRTNTTRLDTSAFGVATGTLIQTETGARRVETLRAGDKVVTRDGGMLPVHSVGHSRSQPTMTQTAVRIAAGVLGNEHGLLVAADHRLFWSDWRAELLFGTDAVLVRARDLVGMDGITKATGSRDTEYWNILFDDHHLVMAEGLWTESLQLAAEGRAGSLGHNARPMIAVCYSLRSHEAEVLRAYCQGATQCHIAAQLAA